MNTFNQVFTNKGNPFNWISIAILGFAILFLIVGILRTVEFNDISLKKLQKTILIGLHILGCLLFSAALTVLAVDQEQYYNFYLRILLFSAILILFPIHIFVGIKRKILLNDTQTFIKTPL